MRDLMQLLHRAGQSADHLMTQTLQSMSLTPRQAVVIQNIEEFQPVTQTAIVHHTGIDRSTVADICERMQERGFIDRERDKTDARAYVIVLTVRGERIAEKIRQLTSEQQSHMMAHVPVRHREPFLKSLEAIAKSTGPIPSAQVSRRAREAALNG